MSRKANLCRSLLMLLLVLLAPFASSNISIVRVGAPSPQELTGVRILGIQSVSSSLPAQVRRESVIRVAVKIKNTGEAARAFYVGASIIGEGEARWKDLPSWGTTPFVNPDDTYTFRFGDYTIPSNAYRGYHGIVVKVWGDSQKATQLAERWFPQVILVGEQTEQAYIALSFDFETDDESSKSTGYVTNSTLDTMEDIIDLLIRNEFPATIFVQGACLDNLQSGSEFKNIIAFASSEGIEIASHSYSHSPDINSLAETDIEREITRTEDLLYLNTGVYPIGFRAPYFAYGERLWNALAKRGYLYDSSVWQHEPAIYSVETPSGTLIQVPWKHQDGDTSYSDLSESITYASSYAKTRVIDFHPQVIKSHWEEFYQFIGFVSNLRSENKVQVLSLAQLAQAAPRSWEDPDHDNIPNYLDKDEFSVLALKSSLTLFGLEWSVGIYVITPSIDTSRMLSALYEEGVEDLGSYTNVVPVVIDVRFPFPNVDVLLDWLAGYGIIDFGNAYSFRSQIESLFSSDGHIRISLILKWNDVNDWDIDCYAIRDHSPVIWKLLLVTFLIHHAPVFVSVAAWAYQLLVKGEPINPHDVLAEAVGMIVFFIVMHVPIFGPLAKGFVWAVGTWLSVGQLLEAIRDPRLDLHLYDTVGHHVLGVDYASETNVTTSPYGIYFGISGLSQYIIASRLQSSYIISVVSHSDKEIEYCLYGIGMSTNRTILSIGKLAPADSVNGRVYTFQNEIRATQLVISVTLSKSSMHTDEDARLTIHIGNENGTSVSDAHVLVQANDNVFDVVNEGDGFYESTVKGSVLAPGNYTVEISASKIGILQDMKRLSLAVSQAPLKPIHLDLILYVILIAAFALATGAAVVRYRRRSQTIRER